MGRGIEQTLFQRHTHGQQVHENALAITNHQADTDENHKEDHLTWWDGCYRRDKTERV